MNNKMTAGEYFPALSWMTVQGAKLCTAQELGWRVLIVYRGKHCPLCKSYLNTLNEMLDEFLSTEIKVSVVSADKRKKPSHKLLNVVGSFR